MDAAKDQERTCSRKADLDRLTRLLRSGIEVERRIEYPHVMGAAVVVDDPQSLAARKCDMGRMKCLLVLRDGANVLRRSRRTAFHCYDFLRQARGLFARERAQKRDQIRALRLQQLEPTGEILGERRAIDHAAHVV